MRRQHGSGKAEERRLGGRRWAGARGGGRQVKMDDLVGGEVHAAHRALEVSAAAPLFEAVLREQGVKIVVTGGIPRQLGNHKGCDTAYPRGGLASRPYRRSGRT